MLHKIITLTLLTSVLLSNSALFAAPRITHIEWGKTQVTETNGTVNTYVDCKLSPAGSEKWDWKQTNMHHHPGVQVADVKELITADIIVISRGMELVLETMPETITYLKSLGKEYYVLQSEEAVKKYNELVDAGKKVAALIHSTC